MRFAVKQSGGCPRNLTTVDVKPQNHLKPSPNSVVFGLLNVRSLANKQFFCNDFIVSKQLDLFMLTEMWLYPGDCVALNEAFPPGFNYFQ